MKKSIVALTCALLSIIVLAGCECGHKDVSQATCTSGAVCKDCGETMGEAVGHQFESATCTKPERCSVCNEASGAVLGHNYSDATCTEGQRCTVCNELKRGSVRLGHDVKEWVVLKESSCTEEGEKSGFCDRCQSEITVSIPTENHVEGEWEVSVQAKLNEIGKKVLSCKVCKRIIKSMNYSISESEFKELCKTYSYEEIARYPDKYKGELAKFTGEVVQVISTGNYYILRVDVTKNKYGWYEDTVYVTYTAPSGSGKILEEDIIEMYGELCGEKTYESILGATITIPSFSASIIELVE